MGKIILGITGSIAAYKGAEILREFQKRGWEVQVAMTEAATKFISPLTLQTLSSNRVIVKQFEDVQSLEHITLCKEAEALLIAPATADFIAKMASGLADDFLSSVFLACQKPVFVAPAMNQGMLLHPATRRNLETLRCWGIRIIEPEKGYLACEDEGLGRLPEPRKIVFEVLSALGKELKGKKVLVTAGPTREYIDDVRFISNPSTGKQGAALAEQASLMGAEVVLLLSEASPLQPLVKTQRFSSSEDLLKKVLSSDFHWLFMTAAVGDFAPREKFKGKLKREGELVLRLEPTPDLLKEIASRKKPGQVIVGFAAETGNFLERGREKLLKKSLDYIFVNPVGKGKGFASDENQGWLISREGEVFEIPLSSKEEVARKIIEIILKREEE